MSEIERFLERCPIQNGRWLFIFGQFVSSASAHSQETVLDPWNESFRGVARELIDARTDSLIGWAFDAVHEGVAVECVLLAD